MLSHSCKRISVAMTLPHPKALRVMADSPASAEPERRGLLLELFPSPRALRNLKHSLQARRLNLSPPFHVFSLQCAAPYR